MNALNKIQEAFYPDLYSELIENSEGLNVCLTKRKGMARYALFAKKFDPKLGLQRQIADARRLVRELTGALWLFKEVGVYVVFICDSMPDISERELVIDKTGFHAVIVQGVHLVSSEGQHLFNHSKWLNHSFRGSESIVGRIKSVAIQ